MIPSDFDNRPELPPREPAQRFERRPIVEGLDCESCAQPLREPLTGDTADMRDAIRAQLGER